MNRTARDREFWDSDYLLSIDIPSRIHQAADCKNLGIPQLLSDGVERSLERAKEILNNNALTPVRAVRPRLIEISYELEKKLRNESARSEGGFNRNNLIKAILQAELERRGIEV